MQFYLVTQRINPCSHFLIAAQKYRSHSLPYWLHFNQTTVFDKEGHCCAQQRDKRMLAKHKAAPNQASNVLPSKQSHQVYVGFSLTAFMFGCQIEHTNKHTIIKIEIFGHFGCHNLIVYQM